MKGVTVSIDRIVIDFTDVYWDFFNEFHKRICHFYGVKMTVGEREFQYRIKINVQDTAGGFTIWFSKDKVVDSQL